MNILITYDVNTQSVEGEKRLRQVARVCEGFGQRVQNSVFECSISEADLERLRAKLLKVIDEKQDSLRIYRLPSRREGNIEAYGLDRYRDLSAPLII
ncbi:MAG: CRISPR-associated endonuclease Cas2 [Chloroherpetonaceae bacterium]|nr:CRISPR-associated endonuclease Cas2 [Chloroherpetonaceae bacterium]